MKTDARDSLNLDVPVDDGSIGRALDELQAKIGVWREAVRDAKQCAEEAARAVISDRKAAAEPDASAPTDERAPGADIEPIGGDGAAAGVVGDANSTGGEQRRSQETALEQKEPMAGVDVLEAPGAGQSDPHSPEAPDAASSDLESPEVTPEVSKAAQTRDAPLGVMMPESADMVRARQVLTKVGGKAKEAIDEESEALLADLEHEVANKIRVQYRLFDGRKSIRELIDQYQREPTKEAVKKSWWQRMNQ